jgi:hypothetical protein
MLSELKNKIDRLIALYEKEKEEKVIAMREREEFAKIIDAKNEEIKVLEKRISNLLLGRAFVATSGDKLEAKHKIGRIVREINECIAMLNN